MAITGKIIALGQIVQGTSKAGNPWKKQEYVLETFGQYAKKVAFSIMNDKIDQANIQIGQTVEIEVDAESREYNGKWYTDLRAWKVYNRGFENAQQQPQAQPVYQQQAPQGYAPQPQNPGYGNNNLPY